MVLRRKEREKATMTTEREIILDRLIRNAKLLKSCDKDLCKIETELLKKVQWSLFAGLLHIEDPFETSEKENNLTKKMGELRKLSPELFRKFPEAFTKNPSLRSLPKIGRNRRSSKHEELAYRAF